MSGHMSKQPILPMGADAPKHASKRAPAYFGPIRRRWVIYASVGVAAILALAYFDGGEEPIHPISQSIAHSTPASLETVNGAGE